MIEVIAAAWAGTVLAQASPGPNLAAVASAGLGQGRRAALMVVLGIASGVFVWAAAVAFGLGAILAAFPALMVAMKLIGGAYLLWLAARAFRSVLTGTAGVIAPEGRRGSDLSHWRHGVVVVLTNPKAALMWAAVASFLFGQGMPAWVVLAFGPLGALTAGLVYGAYALMFSTGIAIRAYARAARLIQAAFGAVFGTLGATLAFDGIREARG